MEKAISASDANRKFSALLRDVREGRTYVVTSHGRPVARIAPLKTNAANSPANRSRASLLKRLRSQPVVKIGRWNRDELYE